MSHGTPARAAVHPSRAPASPPSAPVATTGLTVFGCAPHEAALFRELAPRFGVRATLTEAEVGTSSVVLTRGTRCISVGHRTPVTPATLDALSRAGVRYICTRSVGCDHIDVQHAERVGIRVGNVAYSPDSVADHTLMLMLMAVRHARSVVRRVEAHDYRLTDAPGRELRDLTVGVVGTGRIGRAVLDRLGGFGCRVLTHDLHPERSATHVPLDELLRRSDVVTLHVPLSESTHHLLDRGRIARLRPGAVVVNTGRGALLDTEALVAALERGRLGAAALDVLEGENGIFSTDHRGVPVGNELLLRLHALPNVVLTPHTAYYTAHALRDVVENTLISCVSFGRQHG